MRSVLHSDVPALSSIVAYKAGMTHFTMIDDTESSTKGAEISKACTILEIPETTVYGMRFYSKDSNNYTVTSTEVIVSSDKKKNEEELNKMQARMKEFSDVTALAVANPGSMSVDQNHPVRFESPVGGKTVEEKFKFLSSLMGKRLTAKELFKNGEFVDVMSITKGKGWQGPVKRFGIRRLQHKATVKRRHVGTLGPATPPKVFYTVPHAGQLGDNYRTEHNKRIFKIGEPNDTSINPSSGYMHYGLVKNDYILVGGSVPGVAKALVRVRRALRNMRAIKEPTLSYIAIAK
jgi:large subunit ribosomal protein L3